MNKKIKRKRKAKKKPTNKGFWIILSTIILVICAYICFLTSQIDRQIKLNHQSLQIIKQHEKTINETKESIKRLNIEKKRKVSLLSKEIKQLSGFNHHSRYIARHIIKSSYRLKYNPYLITSLIYHESNFKHMAKSTAGARGLMQILPSTAKHLGYSPDHLYKIGYNLRVGIGYLKYLERIYKNPKQILMAYNAGPGNVKRNNINQGTHQYASNIISMTKHFERKKIV